MVQICYLRLKLGSEAVSVSCCLLLRMVRMDMDLDLKKMSQLFKVLMLSPKQLLWLMLRDEIFLISFLIS